MTAGKRDVSEGEGSLVGKARSSKDAQSDSWKETDCKKPVKPTQEADASAGTRAGTKKANKQAANDEGLSECVVCYRYIVNGN